MDQEDLERREAAPASSDPMVTERQNTSDSSENVQIENPPETLYESASSSSGLHAPMPLGCSPSQPAKRKRLAISICVEDEDLDTNNGDLSCALRRTKGELIQARALNTKLEHQLCQLRSENAQQLLETERNANEMKAKLGENINQIELLKEEVSKLTMKEDELLDQLHKQTETHCEKVKSLEERLSTLETENMQLKGRFELESHELTEKLRNLSATLEATENGVEELTMELQLLQDKLSLRDSQLSKYQDEVKEAQAVICDYHKLKTKYGNDYAGTSAEEKDERIRHFENLYAKQQGDNKELKEMMERVVEENRTLRSRVNQEALLEGQIEDYERTVKHLKAMLEGYAELEMDVEALRTELQGWKMVAFKLDPNCTESSKLAYHIRKVQNELLEATHELSTCKLRIKNQDETISKNVCDLQTLREQLGVSSTENDDLSQKLKETDTHLHLVTKDRDSLKELVESYEQEFEGQLSTPLLERIKQLEETLTQYEAKAKGDASNKNPCSDYETQMD